MGFQLKFKQDKSMSKKINKVVLAYSGGMDTSVILKWLQVKYACQVITLTCDLGQEEDLDGVDKKAKNTGAVKAYVEDVREEFAEDFIFPAFRAGAIYEDRYLLGTSIARPLIAKRLVEIARENGADAVAHGATGKGNDQVRFELTVNALAPDIQVIAPWRVWELKSRTDLVAFAEKHGIPLSSGSKHYSMDRNMLHLSFEGGELEDPWLEAQAGSFVMTVPPEKAPDEAEYVTLDYEAGDPVAVNGNRLSPAALIKTLNALGGKHAIGRIDMVENRFVGMKARGVYETPGGTILHAAHRDLEGICLDREVMHLRDSLIPRYASCIYNGFWYAPEREAIQALVDQTQKKVTGTVRLKLYKGNVLPVARKSPHSLFRQDLATFEQDEVYNQADAAGFIRLNGLRLQGYRKDLLK
jgi:argininosuccinate synthase